MLTHLLFANDMVLFSEASQKEVKIIKDYLDDFCNASGQKINPNKSQIFFSANVSDNEASQIASMIGFERTTDLGNYLGVPSLHGRVKSYSRGGRCDSLLSPGGKS